MAAYETALRWGARTLAIAFLIPASVGEYLIWRAAELSALFSALLALVVSVPAAVVWAWLMMRAFRIVRLEIPIVARRSRTAACLERFGFRLEATERPSELTLKPPVTGVQRGVVLVTQREGVAVVTGPEISARIPRALVSVSGLRITR